MKKILLNSMLLLGVTFLHAVVANGQVTSSITLTCPSSTNIECTGPGGTLAELRAEVSDAAGDALTIVWTANDVAVQTNSIAAGVSTNVSEVPFLGLFEVGSNVVTITVSDGSNAPVTCTATVTVTDTTPPLITGASVTPNTLWPPNHKMVPVSVSVTANDICGTATCRIKSIQSSEPVRSKGDNTSPDWKITGDLKASLRAERLGQGDGRTYTITLECTDESGNTATHDVIVTVPHDQGKGSSTNAPGPNLPPQANGNPHPPKNPPGKNK